MEHCLGVVCINHHLNYEYYLPELAYDNCGQFGY